MAKNPPFLVLRLRLLVKKIAQPVEMRIPVRSPLGEILLVAKAHRNEQLGLILNRQSFFF
ncbi:hypothetical protein EHV15_12645 [Paenibacillus oralis]|uniref:Uncharacterized protein n=1 Tax=Paenibacillus oralis TaxID=2490856 RepID=A0A3P3U0T6_9BACL|nr:hypothetical protein [Paenibacillus oralis]RRJ63684.1 hypothetical protein EHV15_12645 [Paenibacillus oralis]